MSKENKCNQCKQQLGKGLREWKEYHIFSEKLNPRFWKDQHHGGKELIVTFDIRLCSDCWEQEKDKYDGKEEYSIYWMNHRHGGIMSGGMNHQYQKLLTRITEEALESFKKKFELKSIEMVQGEDANLLVFVDKNGKKLYDSGWNNLHSKLTSWVKKGLINNESIHKIFQKYLESKGKGSTPPPHILPTKSLNWSLR